MEKNNLNDPEKYNDLNPGGAFYNLCPEVTIHRKKFLLKSESLHEEHCDKFCVKSGAYKQLALTEYDTSKGTSPNASLNQTGKCINTVQLSDPTSQFYAPEEDERNYTVRNKYVTGYFNHILNSFRAKVSRVRFAYMAPGFEIIPHIDYGTNYSIRVHMPIYTNFDSVMGWANKDRSSEEVHLEADGSVWFINTGLTHFAANRGNTPRIHLIICLVGQEDLWDVI